MPTTREDIVKWLADAPDGTGYMIVMCDTFDWDDYPVYVPVGEAPKDKCGGSMQKPMECYDLRIDFKYQVAQERAWNWGPQGAPGVKSERGL